MIMGSSQEAEANVPPAYINGAPNFQGGQPPLGVTTYSQPPPSVTSNTTGSSPQPTMSQISQGTPVVPVGAQPQYFQPQNVGTVGSMQQLQNPQQPQPNNFGVMMAPSPTFQPGTVNGQQQQQMQQIQQQSPVYGGQPQSPPATSYSASGQPPLQVVSPLHVLGPGPGAVQCPSCGSRGITNITLENGSTTHLWAVIACLFICMPCIPYLINDTKDVRHSCSTCGVALATYKRSGGTVVHAFGRI